MIITRAQRSDAPALAHVMFDAIRQGATLYSVPQRRAWIPKVKDSKDFARIFVNHHVWVARSIQGPQGFIAVRRDSYINLVFILPHARGRGMFRRLMAKAETVFPGTMTVHASLQAEPAFAALGFEVQERERIPRNGQILRRCFMRRD